LAKRSDGGVGREKNARDEIISPLRPRVPLGAARHRVAMYLANAVSTGPPTDLEGCSFLDLSCRRREPSERQKRRKPTRGTVLWFFLFRQIIIFLNVQFLCLRYIILYSLLFLLI